MVSSKIIKPLTGQQFGRLTVLEGERNNGTTRWTCACICGRKTNVTHTNLLSGSVRSCGCLLREYTTGGQHARRATIPTHNIMLSYYKSNAKKRGVVWELSNDEFIKLVTGNCAYCGAPPQLSKGVRKELCNGIDRVDSNQGYTINNSVTCCTTCNKAKLAMSLPLFKEWVEKVYHHLCQTASQLMS